MGTSRRWVTALILIAVFSAACGPIPARGTEQASVPINLPAETIVELPLSAVPVPEKPSVLAPSVTSPSGAQLQVLRVLDDPHEVPLQRFLSYRLPSGEIVSHPLESEIRDALEGKEAAALAVYVRVKAPAYTSAPDPLTSPLDARSDSLQTWTPLTVVAADSGIRLPCAPPAGANHDSHQIGAPEPSYPAAEPALGAGEVREGWLLCLALADHSDSATLEWTFSGETETASTSLAWAPLARMPAGAWHMIKEGTVIGWNEGEQANNMVELPSPPPSRFPAPTSAIPESDAEIVYQGPVWVSIGFGISYPRNTASSEASLGNIFHVQRGPGDCPGVAVWYRDRGVDCPPTGDDRTGRLAIQFMFPVEKAQAEWDHLALDERFDLDLYVQDSLDGLFGTAEGIEVQSRGTWAQADLPGGTATIWASLTPDGPSQASSRTPVWEIPLYVADFGQVNSQDGICVPQECFDAGAVSLSPSARADLQLDMPIPLLDLGESGHGVTPRLVRQISGQILVNDNLHGQDFLPRKLSNPWLLIDIATVNDRAQRSFLVYPGGGGYEISPLEMVHYYQGSSGPLVVRYDTHAGTRRGDEGFALLGTLPAGVPLEEVFLVMANTGPAWRLQ